MPTPNAATLRRRRFALAGVPDQQFGAKKWEIFFQIWLSFIKNIAGIHCGI